MKLFTDIRERIAGRLAKEAAKRGLVPAGGVVAAVAAAAADSVSWTRVALCLAALLLVPLLLFGALRRLVARRSNGVNAAVLAGFTAFDGALGLVALRGSPSGGLQMAVEGAFLVGGLLYTVWAMSYALRLEK